MPRAERRLVRLEEVCQRITVGHVGPMASEYVDNGVPFLRSQDIRPFRVDLKDVKYVGPAFHSRLRKSALKPGDVVVVRTGYPGVAAVVPDTLPDSNCADLVVVTVRPSELDPAYLVAVLNSAWGRAAVSGNLVGVAQQHFNVGAARRMKLELPSVAEQRRVLGVLSAYGELVENNRRQNRVLDEMTRAFFREMFPLQDQVGWNGALVPPAGWRVETLGSLAEEVRRNVAKGELGDKANYVGLEHIPRRSLALDDWLEVAQLGSNKLAFKTGEVLFGKIRPYFHKVSVAPFDGVCSADTIVLGPKEPEDYGLVVAVVSSDTFVQHATATSNGAKMPRASWSVLREYPVLVPSLQVRRRFSGFVTNVVALQRNLVLQNRNLRQTRDLLLPRLLAGQMGLDQAEDSLVAEAVSASV